LSDGGLSSASPLSPMQSILSTKLSDKCHIVYVNGVNVDLIDTSGVGNSLTGSKKGQKSNPTNTNVGNNIINEANGNCNLLNSGVLSLSELIMAQIVADRSSAHNLVSRCRTTHFVEKTCTLEALQSMLIWRASSHCVSSLIELVPAYNCSVPVTSFTGNDVMNLMDWVRNNAIVRMWWVGSGDVDD